MQVSCRYVRGIMRVSREYRAGRWEVGGRPLRVVGCTLSGWDGPLDVANGEEAWKAGQQENFVDSMDFVDFMDSVDLT